MNKTSFLALAFAALFAVSSAPVLAQDAGMPDNVLKVIKSNKEMSKFADLVSSAGMESEMTNKESNLTVFVPNNAAMDKIPSDVMKKAKAQKDGLKSLVRYHIIEGSVVYGGNIKGRRASPSAANGEMLGFDGLGKELKVNDAVIVTQDLHAKNGIVHLINAPLIPLSLNDSAQEKIKSAQEAERKKTEEEMKARVEKAQAERAKEQAEHTKEQAKAVKETEKKMKEEAGKAAATDGTGDAASSGEKAPAAASPLPAPKFVPPAVKAPEEKPLWKKLLGM